MKFLLAFLLPVLFAHVSSAVFLEVRDLDANTFAMLSFEGTNKDAVKGTNLVPRGSASITPSGALSEQGIKYIIHAAPAAMGPLAEGSEAGEPTLESIRLSILNSIRLAEKVGAKSVAIPLIGGGIFFGRLNVTKEQLAYEIINAAYSSKTKLKVVFVGYEDDEYADMGSAFTKGKGESAVETRLQLAWYKRLWIWATSWIIKHDMKAAEFFENAQVVHGSIIDFNLHKSEAIVNAANMELTFGAGLSGFIGDKTKQAAEIDAVNQKLVEAFQARLP